VSVERIAELRRHDVLFSVLAHDQNEQLHRKRAGDSHKQTRDIEMSTHGVLHIYTCAYE
jgi:hypothetical protein